jgi:hypothetical protein
MATVAEKRAWLRDHGHDVPARGRLGPELELEWERGQIDAEWDAFGDDEPELADPDDLEPSVPMQPERPPRTARASRAQTRSDTRTRRRQSFVDRLAGGSGAKGKTGSKKKVPRMSVEKFTSRIYSNLGRMVAPLSQPLSNCLQAQATFAGVVLEDIIQGTIVDRALQPMARAEDKLGKGFALFTPPLCVLAIEHSMTLPADQMMMRQAFIMPVLREALRVGLEVSEEMADQLQARVEANARSEAEVDKLIALIFGQRQAAPEPEMAAA